ncbi:MAG: PAS domain-containing protein [Gammaproteobacteria bacterium]|nr:PAS domain-containing protein [Gammaproteobacteria bacterium]
MRQAAGSHEPAVLSGGIAISTLTQNDNAELSGKSAKPLMLGVFTAVLGLLLVFAISRLEGSLSLSLSTAILVALAVLLGFGFLAYRMLRYRLVLERLRLNMLDAQEGTLKPVDFEAGTDAFLDSHVDTYNTMMKALHRVFATVEECQSRVLAERNRINAILQSLPGTLLSVDDDLCVNASNSQAASMFNLPKEALTGRSLFELLALGEVDRNLLRDAFLYKHRIRNQEIEVRLNGNNYHLTLNLAFVSETGADMGAVIILQDISEYKHLQESVYSHEKLIAMGQLAAGVAHELNTPLGSIMGYAQLLRDAVGKDPKIYQWTSVICDEARRCSRIVDDLLRYARTKDDCEKEICDINAEARIVSETFISCRMKRKNIGIDLQLAEGELTVEGSCGQLEIVLVNLLTNAIQALGETAEPRIMVRTERLDSERAVLIVEDNGPGIARDIRGRIFDPFFTTKDVGNGSGLGLAICHSMLNRRGGSIRHDADFQSGARFIVELPRTPSRNSGHE